MIRIRLKKRMNLIGAIVVVLNKEKDILILKRPNWVHWGASKWAFPGGKIEDNESSLDAAIRETKEETNLDVRDLEVLELDLDIPIAAYYTSTYSGEVRLDFEHDDWAWTSRDEIEGYDLAPDVLAMYDWVLENERK